MEGERRNVTLLFADVVDSTALAEKLDPENWTELMSEAFGYLTEPVRAFDGTVARLMGDGMLAFFGAPTAHEDDPQRAVMAALQMLDAIRLFAAQVQRSHDLDFRIRVGINTGPVVAGIIGERKFAYDLWGDSVNTASRIESQGIEDCIQLTEGTYDRLRATFVCEARGTIALKGKAEMRTFLLKRKRVHV